MASNEGNVVDEPIGQAKSELPSDKRSFLSFVELTWLDRMNALRCEEVSVYSARIDRPCVWDEPRWTDRPTRPLPCFVELVNEIFSTPDASREDRWIHRPWPLSNILLLLIAIASNDRSHLNHDRKLFPFSFRNLLLRPPPTRILAKPEWNSTVKDRRRPMKMLYPPIEYRRTGELREKRGTKS